MKQKEYLKLVIDVTALNTKLKLQQDQIITLAASCNEHLIAIEAQLLPIQTSLQTLEKNTSSQELIATASIQKRNLHGLDRELKTNIENPVKHQLKQLAPLKEAFQKIKEYLQSVSGDCEFDLTTVQEQIAQAQSYLESSEHELQTVMQRYLPLQEAINKYLQISSKLMLDQELEETTQKTSGLTRKLADLEHLLEETPDLINKHATQFTPLRQALETLTSQTKLLSLTQAVITEKPSDPSKAPKATV
jgi:vacuolar-type H+-ATPase subunit I/STV1